MSTGPGVACVECKTYMRPRTNGVDVLETFEDYRPYKIWKADLLECPDCGKQIINGYGNGPIAEHFEGTKFQTALAKVDLTIVGCPRSLPPAKGDRPCITA